MCLVIMYILFYVCTLQVTDFLCAPVLTSLKRQCNCFQRYIPMCTKCGIRMATFNRSSKMNVAVRGLTVAMAKVISRLIQVLLKTSERKQPPLFSCRFQNGTSFNISTGAVTLYYEMNGLYSNFGLFVACFIITK